ncbi:hypothetical protein FQN54_000496 [Arachnomyces sp. PD_36]|nr:hypothetical protein FQN54_000496 [Arachnomyces sp. PD_36]
MSGAVEALYIFDEHNVPILEHTYRSRPPSAQSILPLYLAHPAPRPSLIYLPSASPPVTVFSITASNLLLLAPSSVETEPLIVLEFLHRVVDILEEFIGAPLLGSKIQNNYDVVAQLLIEMCDAGTVCNTESNALQDSVELPGWMGKLLGGVGLPGSSPSLNPSNSLKQSLSTAPKANGTLGPAIPWRRQGVRHTSNELYVDIIETLSVTIAPSGRAIAARSSGTIAFTAKISGVPELVLKLTVPGGAMNIPRKLDLPVFHPCVRLTRWRETPGELSFVPPDGRFVLAGYEVNLLPIEPDQDKPPSQMEKLFLPATVDINKSLGPTGAEFEVRLTLNTNFPGSHLSRGNMPGRGSGTSTPSFLGGGNNGGSSSSPTLDDVVVNVSISSSVRNIQDMRASRGEAHFAPGSDTLEWRVPTKDAGSVSGTATLRCTVVGPLSADDDEEDEEGGKSGRANPLLGYYEEAPTYQESYQDSHPSKPTPGSRGDDSPSTRSQRKIQLNAALMPTSASVSFSARGWLPSGIRVDALTVDPRKSRGLGEGVKPYKGVKYICVSQQGVETRC